MTDQRRTWAVASLAAIVGAGLGAELAAERPARVGQRRRLGGRPGRRVLLVLLIASPRGRSVVDTPIAMAGDAGWSEFRRELRRSRRGERSLTLMRIAGPDTAPAPTRPADHPLAAPGRPPSPRRPDMGGRRQHLRDAARVPAGGRRSSCSSASGPMDPGLLPSDIRVATFPEDGLTSGALIAAVHGASFDARADPDPHRHARARRAAHSTSRPSRRGEVARSESRRPAQVRTPRGYAAHEAGDRPRDLPRRHAVRAAARPPVRPAHPTRIAGADPVRPGRGRASTACASRCSSSGRWSRTPRS